MVVMVMALTTSEAWWKSQKWCWQCGTGHAGDDRYMMATEECQQPGNGHGSSIGDAAVAVDIVAWSGCGYEGDGEVVGMDVTSEMW